MPVGEVLVKLNLNKDGYSAGMTAARKEAQQTVKTIEQMGHSTVSSMQASSAAIRVLEGGMTGNIRAAERFISMIPGVGKALQAAFPIVGGIALAGVFVKIGEEAAKAIQKINQAEQSITNSFRTLNLSGQTANDTLAITNDRLENEIAKLQGKPQNNLKIAIDEARLAAGKMAESLDRDNTKIKELLSQNAVPWWAGFLGKAGTSNVSTAVNAQNQKLADMANEANILQHQGDQAGADKIRGDIKTTRQGFIRDNAADAAARRASQGQPGALNQGANVSIDLGQQSSLLNQIDQENELKRNLADQAQKQKLEDIKAQQEAAKRAMEAAKQAQLAIVEQWREALGQDRANSEISLAQEASYWQFRAETAKKGSLSYTKALDEANKAIARINADTMNQRKELAKKGDQFDKTSAISPDSMDLSRGDIGTEREQGRSAAEFLKTMNEGISQRREDANAIAEQSLQMEVLTGRMSKLGEAQALAALHAQAFADAQERIDVALANAAKLPDSLDKQRTIAGLNNQSAQVSAQAQMQGVQDQQAIASQQLGPATRQALGAMVNDWSNMTTAIVQTMTKTMDSFNDNIVKAMMGHGSAKDFGRTFSAAGEGLLKTGLQGAEGKIMGAFGLGKRDGSSAQAALYTIDASSGGAGSLGGSKIPFVQPFLGGQQGQSGGGGLGGFFKTLMGGLFKAPGGGGGGGGGGSAGAGLGDIGIFGGGGDFMANHPMIVGDKGPELLTPGFSGHITPNNRLGGGGDTHVYHIDARGSNDPAAVHAAVARALPHAVAASVQANHQAKMRSPHGR